MTREGPCQRGAATTVYCCVGAPMEQSGGYFSNCNATKPAGVAMDVDLARALWEKAESMTARVSEEDVGFYS